MDIEFTVDASRCTGCQACIKECPINLPILAENGTPTVKEEDKEACIGCQHCMMVCPTGALSVMGLDPQASDKVSRDLPAPGQMARLIKSRRSIRQYRNKAVPWETISFLLETALLAPTAVNNRKVAFTVVDEIGTMDKLRKATYKAMQVKKENGGALPEKLEHLDKRFRESPHGSDFIYRGAPHLLVASASEDSYSGEVDCLIALSYFELLAASHGIGTLWLGLAKLVFTEISPGLLTDLGVPADHTLGYVMAFGEPAVKFPRTFQAEAPKINRARL